jgi:phosphomannomutase
MLTASHMPMHNNGLKFFTAEGGLGKPDITAILETAAAKCEAAAVPLGDAILDSAFVLRQVRDCTVDIAGSLHEVITDWGC